MLDDKHVRTKSEAFFELYYGILLNYESLYYLIFSLAYRVRYNSRWVGFFVLALNLKLFPMCRTHFYHNFLFSLLGEDFLYLIFFCDRQAILKLKLFSTNTFFYSNTSDQKFNLTIKFYILSTHIQFIKYMCRDIFIVYIY